MASPLHQPSAAPEADSCCIRSSDDYQEPGGLSGSHSRFAQNSHTVLPAHGERFPLLVSVTLLLALYFAIFAASCNVP
jgi:hypothetical protein